MDRAANMPPPWRPSLASSSRFSTFRNLLSPQSKDAVKVFFDRRVAKPGDVGYVEGEQNRQSWKDWAGEKIKRRNSSMSNAVERISMFPGWAVRRYHNKEKGGNEAAEFSLEVYVSGFAASYVPPEYATRSQKAFMRIAKSFAAIQKMQSTDTLSNGISTMSLDSETSKLLKGVKLPPRPSEITEETELLALERQFQLAESDIGSASSSDSESSPTGYSTPQSTLATASGQFTRDPSELLRLHTNLSDRLRPFWSRSLPNRRIRLSVFTTNPRTNAFIPEQKVEGQASKPVFSQMVNTDQQGSFEAKLKIPWDAICNDPGALQIAFGDAEEDHQLFVEAELIPPDELAVNVSSVYETLARSLLIVPVTQSRVRLISDIDDTIKMSNILGGARTIFRNVFVKHLEELVIRGMGDWYSRMWSRGVRFHYVSNGPFELLPVINEFIKVSNLPQGSIRLRSYAGRSLFNGLLSAPANRKRDGILDTLNAFSDSRFFLVGDSGEQDLELYAQIASERHTQILAVFIRDASGPESRPLDDPTGEEIKKHPSNFRRVESFASNTSTSSSLSSASSSSCGKNTPTAPTFLHVDHQPVPTPSMTMRMPHQDSNRTLRRPVIDTGVQEYLTIRSPSTPTTNIATISSSQTLRGSSLPVPSRGPSSAPTTPSSTLSEIGIPRSSSPNSSTSSLSLDIRPAGMLIFPGSLSKSEIAALPPSERRRYELQERVYRARFRMPSHIPLRIFSEPEQCVEADSILDTLEQQARPS